MLLETRNLTVTIEGKTILKDLSIRFAEGKRTAIIGPNGAGKSTLLRALAALNPHYQGEILLDGEDIRKMGRKKLSQRLAILPQSVQAPPDTTVERLVDYGRFPYRSWFRGSNAREDREAVEWALSVTRLEDFRHRQVVSLSGGERQRAWIAMALAQRPEVLLLDEPTTYLDIAHQL
ncbi:MAG: ABC transporter ATP-binding protein, partial [Selenomonadaceae bacterium]|nr:ABC transporter ATP-binding protein [Selenomonadaceae bacterium]